MKLQDVILKAMAKKITWMEAAEISGVTDRTMRRIRQRYQEFGYTGPFDQRRGQRSVALACLNIKRGLFTTRGPSQGPTAEDGPPAG